MSVDRILGGRVVACSDEGFADAANLVADREPEFRFGVFVEGRGQVFDSWETRRHNPEPPDWVIVELGTPGAISTVDIDTHWHDGNHAEGAALWACVAPDDAPARDDARWCLLLPVVDLDGHAHNVFRVAHDGPQDWTHVMLDNHPDGGIARLRCWDGPAPVALDPGDATVRRVRHAAAIPGKHDDARALPDAEAVAARWEETGSSRCNLACESRGGRVVATSNNRYGHSQALLSPEPPASMGDGWETARSRGDDHTDHVVVALGRRGELDALELDFTFFVLNNPVAVTVRAIDDADGALDVPLDQWTPVVVERWVKDAAGTVLCLDGDTLLARGPFTHLRIDTHPDGGCNRLRAIGRAR